MSAPTLAKSDYDVLNVVALKKMASPSIVAQVTGRDEDTVDRAVTDLASGGLVVVAGGAALPTDDAEPALKGAAGEFYIKLRADQTVLELVEKFESVNSQFLTTMSSWQQVEAGGKKVVNDHTDSAYDDKVIGRLEKLISRLTSLLDALGAHDPRFAVYTQRFDEAMAGIDAGHHDLVSSPTDDSVHNIWFEFHEDLLRTLGRERTE